MAIRRTVEFVERDNGFFIVFPGGETEVSYCGFLIQKSNWDRLGKCAVDFIGKHHEVWFDGERFSTGGCNSFCCIKDAREEAALRNGAAGKIIVSESKVFGYV